MEELVRRNPNPKEAKPLPREFPAGEMWLGYGVSCGKCPTYALFFPNPRFRSEAEIEKHLKHSKWRETKEDGWLCPTCADQAEIAEKKKHLPPYVYGRKKRGQKEEPEEED